MSNSLYAINPYEKNSYVKNVNNHQFLNTIEENSNYLSSRKNWKN